MKWRYATDFEAAPYMSDCPGLTFLTPSTILYNGTILRRVYALEDNAMGYASTGDVGGFVEDNDNLSQYHEAWVADCAIVYQDARVKEQGLVKDNAVVGGRMLVHGSGVIANDTEVDGHGWVDEEHGVNDDDDWICRH